MSSEAGPGRGRFHQVFVTYDMEAAQVSLLEAEAESDVKNALFRDLRPPS